MLVLITGIIGLFMGSLAQAVAYRVHAGKNWLSDRSECDHCKKKLEPIDLIPVLSWVIFKGGCRRCKKRLSVEYPLVELGTGVVFALSAWQWPYVLTTGLEWAMFVVWGIILTILTMLFVSDMHWKLLPNGMVLSLALTAAVFQSLRVAVGDIEILDAFTSSVLGILVGGGIFWLIFQVSRGRWIGGGDVKYGAAVGIFLGATGSYAMLMIGSGLGTAVIGGGMLLGKIDRKSQIPFGPFLIAATVLALLFRQQISDLLFSGLL